MRTQAQPTKVPDNVRVIMIEDNSPYFLPDPQHPRIKPDPGDPNGGVIDLQNLRTAAGAAKALHGALQAIVSAQREADKLNMPKLPHVWTPGPNAVWLRTPENTDLVMDEYSAGAWHVSWEGGPFEWAFHASMGEDIGAAEGGYAIRVLLPETGVLLEPGRNFVLNFRN